MASKPTLEDMLLKEASVDFSPRMAAAEMLLLLITSPEGERSAGVTSRVLELLGYIAREMNQRERIHRALRPEFARIAAAADL